MYVSTLPSPCCTKPHFCVQPRKPRQRGGRRAEDLDKTRYLGLSCCPKYRVFCILHGDVFCGLRRVRGEFFRLGSFLCSYEYGKIRVRLMRTEEDVNENEEHFVHVGARLAPLPRGGEKLARSMRAMRFGEGLRGRRINAFRLRGFGHVRGYTPVALHRKAAFLRATSQASTARRPPRGRLR